jgi:signal peptidase II
MSLLSQTQKKAKIASLICLALLVLASIGADQATKVVAERHLMTSSHSSDPRIYSGQRYPIWANQEFPPTQESQDFYLGFNFNYVRNLGAAWGMLSDVPDAIRVPFFHLITLFATTIIVFYLRATPLGHRLARYALVLILSGALGNFIDRLVRGYVIDFIDVNWKIAGWRYYFPNFNIADSCITLGVALLMFDMFVLEGQRRKILQDASGAATA